MTTSRKEKKKQTANWHLVVCNQTVYIGDSIILHSFPASSRILFLTHSFHVCSASHSVTVEHNLERERDVYRSWYTPQGESDANLMQSHMRIPHTHIWRYKYINTWIYLYYIYICIYIQTKSCLCQLEGAESFYAPLLLFFSLSFAIQEALRRLVAQKQATSLVCSINLLFTEARRFNLPLLRTTWIRCANTSC